MHTRDYVIHTSVDCKCVDARTEYKISEEYRKLKKTIQVSKQANKTVVEEVFRALT